MFSQTVYAWMIGQVQTMRCLVFGHRWRRRNYNWEFDPRAGRMRRVEYWEWVCATCGMCHGPANAELGIELRRERDTMRNSPNVKKP